MYWGEYICSNFWVNYSFKKLICIFHNQKKFLVFFLHILILIEIYSQTNTSKQTIYTPKMLDFYAGISIMASKMFSFLKAQ